MAGKVLILMGSKSDAEEMGEAARVLSEFGIPYTLTVASAHRSPGRTREIVSRAEKEGLSGIIAGAGAAAHLAGFVAAETVLPVIGVPLAGSPLFGVDFLLATAQMPAGGPGAARGVGEAGARRDGPRPPRWRPFSPPVRKKRSRRRSPAACMRPSGASLGSTTPSRA